MELRDIRGFKWPNGDLHCHAVVFNTVTDMLPALDLCRGNRLAIQAGGNCGVWASWLADRFDIVVTAEPDPINYACLRQNVPANVRHLCAALGATPDFVGMETDQRNIGAHFIKGEGTIRVLTIDSLEPEACDYLCLDVEGYEMPALMGAEETIREFKPVIQIEDKGLSEKYGHAQGDAEKWLARFGYQVRHRIHRDVILSC